MVGGLTLQESAPDIDPLGALAAGGEAEPELDMRPDEAAPLHGPATQTHISTHRYLHVR